MSACKRHHWQNRNTDHHSHRAPNEAKVVDGQKDPNLDKLPFKASTLQWNNWFKKKDNTNAGCKFHFTHTSTLNTCSTWHRAGWTFISVSAWMRDVSMMLLNTIFMALKMSPRAGPRAASSWLLYHQMCSCDMRSCFTWPSTNCPIVAFNNLGHPLLPLTLVAYKLQS